MYGPVWVCVRGAEYVVSVIYLALSPMLKVLPSYKKPGLFLLHTHWHVHAPVQRATF